NGVAMYLDGEPVAFDVIRDGLTKDITYSNGEPNLQLGFRFRDNGFKNGVVDDLKIYNRDLTPLEVAQVAGQKSATDTWQQPAEKLNPSQREQLFEEFFATSYEPAK